MNDINSITISGRLARDPILKTIGQSQVAEFTIASNRSKNVDGQWRDVASFFDCVLWGKLAPYLTQNKKGARLTVQGQLVQESWQTQDGSRRSKVVIIVNTYVDQPKPKLKEDDVTNMGYQLPPEMQDEDMPF